MSDTIMNLRELGVAYGFLRDGNPPGPIVDDFFSFCQEHVRNCEYLSKSDLSKNKVRFSKKELQALRESVKAGETLRMEMAPSTTDTPTVTWNGGRDTFHARKPPLVINNVNVRIEGRNPRINQIELHILLNTLLGKPNYKKDSFNVFESFAIESLKKWFETSRNEAIKILGEKSFEIKERGKYIKLAYSEGKLILDINGYRELIDNFESCEYQRFISETTPKYRELVYSRFLTDILSKETVYSQAKTECLIDAGRSLTGYLKELLEKADKESLFSRLFPFDDQKYYLLSIDGPKIGICLIPSVAEATKKIDISHVGYQVNEESLLLYLELRNSQNGKMSRVKYRIGYTSGELNDQVNGKILSDEDEVNVICSKTRQLA